MLRDEGESVSQPMMEPPVPQPGQSGGFYQPYPGAPPQAYPPQTYAPQPAAVPPKAYAPPHGDAAPAPGAYAPPQAYAYAPPQGYPAPGDGRYAPPRPIPTGALSWALGFVLMVPYLGVLASPVTMVVGYFTQRNSGPLAENNARMAANWALTTLSVSVLAVALLIADMFASFGARPSDVVGDVDWTPARFDWAAVGIVFLTGMLIAHVVMVIVGTIMASTRKMIRLPFVFPFFRPPASGQAGPQTHHQQSP